MLALVGDAIVEIPVIPFGDSSGKNSPAKRFHGGTSTAGARGSRTGL